MMRDRPGEEEVLVKKQRSASAVERGGFVEAIGGMSQHDQQRRMFRSLKVHVSCMSLFFLEIIKAPVGRYTKDRERKELLVEINML